MWKFIWGSGTQTLNESLGKGCKTPRGLSTQTEMDRAYKTHQEGSSSGQKEFVT